MVMQRAPGRRLTPAVQCGHAAAAVAAGRIEAGLVILSIDAARGDGPEADANIY
ncbi:hypothetical protein [Streptomyces sp. NPDC003717]|uniref:hypothetical protein n=1 Tax=Streptomyces sp. NPDC003717 TaxID=3154276 RepID=UPI0033A85896